ncbi:MAG: DNA methyltransferase [Chloroflexota bacterium]
MAQLATVSSILGNFRSVDSLKKLLWTELNYDRADQSLPIASWTERQREGIAGEPTVIATTKSDFGSFDVIYCQIDSWDRARSIEREAINVLLREHPYSLFIFSDLEHLNWHFVNVRYAKDEKARRLFRRITVGQFERLRTATERLALLDLASLSPDLFGLSPLAIQLRHDEAFDVEAVTEDFFRDYKRVFSDLQEHLRLETKDAVWAHDYALQLLNRLMFLYFIQRKRWLDNDPDFMRNFWDAYKDNHGAEDTYFDHWLSVLFFEAFNEKFQAGRSDRQYLPENFRNALAQAPYLNGGLFARNALDEQYAAHLPDTFFESLFDQFDSQTPGFLERYNFTITEDTPFDQEVAVDPEMIGKVYESLVNIAFEGVDETDQRGDAGIFYTPRVEIDLMCRLTLLDYTTNHLDQEWRSLLRNAIFAYDLTEKRGADDALAQANLWPRLDQLLRDATFLDPACGSGSFLIGMLSILDDLQARTNVQLGIQETPYERRKRIIGQSLYGVDVMKWAVHVAELRLWLQLVVETDLHPAELKFRPLLPNLSFKVRAGDSLVQDVGGINFSLHHPYADIPASLKGKLTQLKAEKLKFFNGDQIAKYRTEDALRQQELALFREILGGRTNVLEERIKSKRRTAQERNVTQPSLIKEVQAEDNAKGVAEAEAEAEALQSELEQVRSALAALKQVNDVPFVWDIAFVEIFEGERNGFDMVAGNPPYVRQEKIAPPTLNEEDYAPDEWKKLKDSYKTRLQASAAAAFPKFFGYKSASGQVARKLDGKSDLYIYFYLHGLSLLNSHGAFAFITSNSWLDVGYGKELQEFLLKHGHVRLLIDNQVKRSFKQADVNTVIALLGPTDDAYTNGLEKDARFVMFTVPFEQALSSVLFAEIEEVADRLTRQEFRVFRKRQGDLLEEGLELPEEDEETPHRTLKAPRYTGNKWGGKYLRAPEIYFTILSKGKSRTEQLATYFKGERYLNTGGADGFFIPTSVTNLRNGKYQVFNDHVTIAKSQPFEGELDEKYLVPLIKDYTKSDKRIEIRGHDAYCVVIKGDPNSHARKYIEWGELQRYHLRSATKNQSPWYKPTNQMLQGAKILVPRSFNDTFVIYHNPHSYLSLRFYRLHPIHGKTTQLIAFLNSTLVALMLETLGNKNLGQGVLDFFMADFLALRIPIILEDELDDAYKKICSRPILNVKTEYGFSLNMQGKGIFNPTDDRILLDQVIFDAIHLTQYERDAVYEAVIDQVEARLKKAGSLSSLPDEKE